MRRHITGSAAVAVCWLAAASASPVAGETAAPNTVIAKPDGGVALEAAPRAAQIEPMVAPVKRSSPQTPANTASKSAKSGEPGTRAAKISETEAPGTKTIAKAGGKKAR